MGWGWNGSPGAEYGMGATCKADVSERVACSMDAAWRTICALGGCWLIKQLRWTGAFSHVNGGIGRVGSPIAERRIPLAVRQQVRMEQAVAQGTLGPYLRSRLCLHAGGWG
jgi:hypothetical protein